MLQWGKIVLLLTLLSGCVTVTSEQNAGEFDNIEAAEARISLGLGYMEAGDRQKARENLELAVQYAPDYYRSQISIAYYYQQVGENELAESSYKKALRSSPNNGNVLNNYGVFLCKHARYDEAQQAFSKAIKQPYYYLVSASYENAAMCSLSSGDNATAKQYFERSIAHDPSRARSILQLAKLKIDDMELNEARVMLLKFHKMHGYQPASLGLLIELEAEANNRHLVSRYGDVLAEQYPSSIQYQQYLANDY